MSYKADPATPPADAATPPRVPSASGSPPSSPRRIPADEALALMVRELTDSAGVRDAFASIARLGLVAEMSGPMDAETEADLAELMVGVRKLTGVVVDMTVIARRLELRARAATATATATPAGLGTPSATSGPASPFGPAAHVAPAQPRPSL